MVVVDMLANIGKPTVAGGVAPKVIDVRPVHVLKAEPPMEVAAGRLTDVRLVYPENA
jgi:hypothetical protein